MPTEAKPLFHSAALRDAMKSFTLPAAAVAARPKVEDWAKQLGSRQLDAKKETELLPSFVEDVFAGTLGYKCEPAARQLRGGRHFRTPRVSRAHSRVSDWYPAHLVRTPLAPF